MNKRSVFSVGHSSRSVIEFLSLLTTHKITRLVDVRRFPVSRRHPQFTRDGLEESLRLAEIDYRHLGEPLGGFTEIEYREFFLLQTSVE